MSDNLEYSLGDTIKSGDQEYSLTELEAPKKPKVDASTWSGVGEDVGRSVLAKGVKGAAAIPGMLGDIPAMLGVQQYRPPTTEEYMEKIKGISPGVKEAMEYKPETSYGRYAGSVAEFLPGAMVPLGSVGLAGRAISGVGSGLGSELAGDIVKGNKPEWEGTWKEAAAKMAGAISGGLSAPAAVKKIAPVFGGYEGMAAADLAKAQAKDIVSRSAKSEAAGIPHPDVPFAGIAGESAQKTINAAAGHAGPEAIGKYRDAVGGMKQEVQGNLTQAIDDIVGGGKPVSSIAKADEMSAYIKSVNDPNYKRVFNLPEARNLKSANLDALSTRIPPKIFDKTIDDFIQDGKDLRQLGLIETKNGWATSPFGASLEFWDGVKKNIFKQYKSNYDPTTRRIIPGNEADARRFQMMESDLTNTLKNTVNDYGKILFEAKGLYNARSAVNAGEEFFKDMSHASIQQASGIIKNNLANTQRAEFGYGYASALRDMVERNPDAAMQMFSGKQASLNINKMRLALGEKTGNELLAEITAQHLNRTIPELIATGGPHSAKWSGLVGAVAAAGAAEGASFLKAIAAGNVSPMAIVGFMVSSGAAAGLNHVQRKVGEQVLRLAADPSQRQRLAQLIEKNKDARTFLEKMSEAAARSVPAISAEEAPELTIRRARKSGGRITSHEDVADALVRAAERAKKNIGQKTEAILSKPDEVVVRALKIANRNLEG